MVAVRHVWVAVLAVAVLLVGGCALEACGLRLEVLDIDYESTQAQSVSLQIANGRHGAAAPLCGCGGAPR